MACYAIPGSLTTVGTTIHTAIGLLGAASNTRRTKTYDINIGPGGAPASTDTFINWFMFRTTGATAGTNTAVTPQAIDPADAAAVSTAAQNYTAEGTVLGTTAIWSELLNQRAPYRWQTYLGSGAEITTPATASNGWMLQAQGGASGYTGSAGGVVYFQEQ